MTTNNNEKFRSFKSKENIHKREVGPYRGFGPLSLISDPIDLAKGARGKYCKFAIFNMAVLLKTDTSRKIPKLNYVAFYFSDLDVYIMLSQTYNATS